MKIAKLPDGLTSTVSSPCSSKVDGECFRGRDLMCRQVDSTRWIGDVETGPAGVVYGTVSLISDQIRPHSHAISPRRRHLVQHLHTSLSTNVDQLFQPFSRTKQFVSHHTGVCGHDDHRPVANKDKAAFDREVVEITTFFDPVDRGFQGGGWQSGRSRSDG